MIEPNRPLGSKGREFWDANISDGIGPQSRERLLILCEQIDERVTLRVRVLRDNDVLERRALRQLDSQIAAALAALFDNEAPADPTADAVTVLRKVKAGLTAAIAVATPSEISSISKELTRVTAELLEMERRGVTEEVSKADELRNRREARHRVDNDPPSAPRRSQPRRRTGSNRVG